MQREAPGRKKVGGSYEAGDAGVMTTAAAGPSGGLDSDCEETAPTTTTAAGEKGSSRKSKDSFKSELRPTV